MSDAIPFSKLLASLEPDGDADTVTIPPDWLQGRTGFGGLTAAFAVAAARRHHPDLAPLRSGLFAFLGPAAGRLRIETRVLRAGRSARFLGVDVAGDAGPAMHATLCFAGARESALAFDERGMPGTARPEDCADIRRGPDAPVFLQHFDTRLAGASAPLSGGAPDLAAWIRHRDDGDGGGDGGRDGATHAAGEAALLALADVLPPSALCMASAMMPISTMTWAVEVASGAAEAPLGWCLSRRRADFVGDGYVGEAETLHRADGTLLLTGRQSVALFG